MMSVNEFLSLTKDQRSRLPKDLVKELMQELDKITTAIVNKKVAEDDKNGKLMVLNPNPIVVHIQSLLPPQELALHYKVIDKHAKRVPVPPTPSPFFGRNGKQNCPMMNYQSAQATVEDVPAPKRRKQRKQRKQ